MKEVQISFYIFTCGILSIAKLFVAHVKLRPKALSDHFNRSKIFDIKLQIKLNLKLRCSCSTVELSLDLNLTDC